MTIKKIGFIGQGWIGKNYADDFEKRGFEVIRYALDEQYKANKEKIKNCDIVFIAVPTPTTTNGFDPSIVGGAVKLVGKGKIAVIKSTIIPGTTELIQKENPEIFVMHSPEFLVSKTAAYDAANPTRNVIGIPIDNDEYKKRAKDVMEILSRAPFEIVCKAQEAELIKYGGNAFLYFKVIYANLMYDMAEKIGADWAVVRNAISADVRIGASHMEPIHESGRGAGGHCFIKDFAALGNLYAQVVGDPVGLNVLESMELKNIDLLVKSGKDTEVLKGVYGEHVADKQEHSHGHDHDACGCGHTHPLIKDL